MSCPENKKFQDQALEPCYLASGQQDGQIRVGRDRVYLGQLVDYPEAWAPQRLDSQVEDAGENNGNRNGNVHNRASEFSRKPRFYVLVLAEITDLAQDRKLFFFFFFLGGGGARLASRDRESCVTD